MTNKFAEYLLLDIKNWQNYNSVYVTTNQYKKGNLLPKEIDYEYVLKLLSLQPLGLNFYKESLILYLEIANEKLNLLELKYFSKYCEAYFTFLNEEKENNYKISACEPIIYDENHIEYTFEKGKIQNQTDLFNKFEITTKIFDQNINFKDLFKGIPELSLLNYELRNNSSILIEI